MARKPIMSMDKVNICAKALAVALSESGAETMTINFTGLNGPSIETGDYKVIVEKI